MIATVLAGATLILALYAAETRPLLMRIAAAVVAIIVAGVIIATTVGKGHTVTGINVIAEDCWSR